MIRITFVGGSKIEGLVRPDSDDGWLATPVGCAGRAGSGPDGQICLGCVHMDLDRTRWSSHGRAGFCFERARLSPGKACQVVPVNTAACSRFQERPNADVVFRAAADRLDHRVAEKREAIVRAKQIIKRLTEELRELELERGDPGVDLAWSGFEPEGATTA